MKLYFYTKKGCSLCDKGLGILREFQHKYQFEIEARDIYTDDEWLLTYQIRIPVIEDMDGVVLDEGIISYPKLELELKERVTHH
ncbi:glutaredoxin family protein [Evansella tamaricis]|uniref:Glutaredoxin family protein n=1 Tax=Evansella tamaricis TaxID=2069301 RepID=A0ABS6JEM2_9BACI|nr:glutaredoxin family protein [Evansella tamaricis]MBU9712120.1 glutaredoxin family protein [Evansella tamaricis]